MLYEADEAEFADEEGLPVPPELREKILFKAGYFSGMLAAAEARDQGVEINGWEQSPGATAEYYYFTEEEFRDWLKS